MSDVNRVSASEQAARDAQKASQKKIKHSQIQKNGQMAYSKQMGTQHKALRQQSSFDEMLKNQMQPPTTTALPSESLGQLDNRVMRQEDSHSRDNDSSSRDQDDDTEVKDKQESKETSKSSKGGATSERVLSKKNLGSGNQGGSQEEKGHEEGKSQAGLADAKAQLKLSGKTQEEVMAPGLSPFQKTLQAVEASKAAQGPKELPQAVINQIIQSITIARSKELGKEMSIHFKEEDSFFRGLSLKVRQVNGEIVVEFFAPNESLRSLLRSEREGLALALGKREIPLREIEVSLKS